MKVILSPRAEKQLRKLAKIDQIVVAQKIKAIKNLQPGLQNEKLAGYKNIFRVRLGDYRIVYRRFPKEIYIIVIGSRKDVYRLLKQLFN